MITKKFMREWERDSFEGRCLYGTFSGREIKDALTPDGCAIIIDGEEWPVSMLARTPNIDKKYELRIEYGCPDHVGYVLYYEKPEEEDR